MLHSLRLRLLLAMVALVAVTAGAVALLARQFTVAEFQRYLALEDQRNQRVGDLFSAASTLAELAPPERDAAVAAMSARAGERVILVDKAGAVTTDSAGRAVGSLLEAIAPVDAIVIQLQPPTLAGPELVDVNIQVMSIATEGQLAPSGFSAAAVALGAPAPGPGNATSVEGSYTTWGTAALVPTVIPADTASDTMVFFYTQPVTATLGAASAIQLTGEPVAITWSRFAAPDPIAAGFVSGVNRSLGLAVAVAGVAALVLTAALSRRIIRPVAELTTAAERMATGDLSHRVSVRTNDEIAALGRAFNSMATALERAEGLRRMMVGDVAHELRTPLTNISGYLEAMRDGVARPDARTLASLHEEALLLGRLVDDLQDLAQVDAGQLRLRIQPTDLGVVAEQAVAVVQPRLEAKGVSCRLELEPELPAAAVDAERIGQVLRNLLNNALTHTPMGGSVSVAVAWATGEPAPMLAVSVSDTGCGIAPEDLPLIFERFYRADRSRARATGGAGLGLTIVRRLVEAHGGGVTATSEPGAGARFTFTMPVAAGAPAA